MFSKVKKALKSAARSTNPELDVPIVKRIQQLSQIHDLAKSLLHDTRELIKMFDQEEGVLRNSAEAYAASLRVLGTSVKCSHPEYTIFLEKQAEVYDELGHLQRRLQHELALRVATPLSGWLHADFTRMNAEINRMYDKKNEFDAATLEANKDPNNAALATRQDLCHREYDRQMEIAKLELLRLTQIKNEHAKIIAQFSVAWKEYTAGARQLFATCDAAKTTVG